MEKELADIPVRRNLELQRLEEHKKQLAETSEALKRHQAELKKQELEVEARREKIRKLRQQQMELKTNKEFKAIETEIAAVEAEIGKFEDLELVAMDKIEGARSEVKEKEKALAAEEAVVKQDMATWDKRGAALGAEAATAKAERAELAKAVDPKWLQAYERIQERKDRALVRVDDGICGGCHMQLPPFLVHDARARQKIVTCGFCARMLYS